jgi:hypothetical protein
MKYFKTLTLAFTMIFVLATAAVGGETQSPPCVPGETQGPPCTVQTVTDESEVPGETSSPPAEPLVDVTDITEALLWSLLLF